MNIYKTALTLLLASLISAANAAACEPCSSILDLKETLQHSSLVIVGKRIDPIMKRDSSTQFGPKIIRIHIKSILKGSEEKSEIDVSSWFGMCPFGIVLDNHRDHLIALKGKNGKYSSVNSGCAFKSSVVTDKQQTTIQGKSYTLDEIRRLIRQ